MKAWLIAPLVLLVTIGIGGILRYRRRRHAPESFVTDQWRSDHRYTRDGDPRK